MLEILTPEVPNLSAPEAGFYLWLPTPDCDQSFTRFVYEQEHLALLPGSLLSRQINGQNPAYGYVRVAMTASLTDCLEGTKRLCRAYRTYNQNLFRQ
jgi:N-succinyldiaminopimelate aminotransferase